MKQRIAYCTTRRRGPHQFRHFNRMQRLSATPDVAERHPRAAAAVGAVEGNWLIKAMLLAGAAFGLALSVAQVAGLLG